MAETAAVHGPYEDLAIETIALVRDIIKTQPPEVQKQCWEWYVEDVKAWRQFWKDVKDSFPKLG